jgi:hypothetical protein
MTEVMDGERPTSDRICVSEMTSPRPAGLRSGVERIEDDCGKSD